MENSKYNTLQLVTIGFDFKYIAKLITGRINPEETPPDKQLLIKVFQNTHSFKKIAEAMLVKENTVKKWFKTHQLPTTIKNMKLFLQNT